MSGREVSGGHVVTRHIFFGVIPPYLLARTSAITTVGSLLTSGSGKEGRKERVSQNCRTQENLHHPKKKYLGAFEPQKKERPKTRTVSLKRVEGHNRASADASRTEPTCFTD
jgi:hypothetical protein